jgi:Farnesoic acid 0-methyl transferase
MDTPDEHKYVSMWKSVETKNFWSFAVRAGGDVHVILTSRVGRTDSDLYEFVIGGWFNNMSVIRTEILGGGDSIKGTYNQTNLVSATEMRHFWISWYDGLISVSTCFISCSTARVSAASALESALFRQNMI